MTRSIKIFTLIVTIAFLAVAGSAQTLSREKVKQIEQLITAKMSKDRIPAFSIAVAQDGKVIWSNGYGLADIENFVPAKTNTAYRSASVGKPITATAVMQLAEKGKLDLDAPVWQYCKAFPLKKWLLSSRHLLAHEETPNRIARGLVSTKIQWLQKHLSLIKVR